MKIERQNGAFNFYQTERVGEVTMRLPLFDTFGGMRKEFQEITKNSITRTARYLPLHELTINIKNDPKKVIPNHGHSGRTLSEKDIQIKVNPSFSDKETLLQVELPRSISHELHHAVRDKMLPDEKWSLGSALVAEGLATVFETEVWSGEPSAWAKALSKEQMDTLLQKVILERDDQNYNHARWFYGSSDLPKWAGYAIGVHLIKEYMHLHPGETAATLVSTPANVIIDDLRQTVLKKKENTTSTTITIFLFQK